MSALDDRTARAYDVVAATYAELSADVAAVEHPVDRGLLDAFAELARGRGLVGDLGCGPGRLTARLADQGVDAFGLDLSAGMLAVARGRHPDLRFIQGSLARLGLADGALAGALAWYSIIHTEPAGLPQVCAELARVVAPGGHLLVAFQAGRGERVDRGVAYGHAVALTGWRHERDHVAGLLESAGFGLLATTLRAPVGREVTPQAFLLGQRAGSTS